MYWEWNLVPSSLRSVSSILLLLRVVMVVNGGGQGLSSWVPGASTSEEEEEEEEAASELMLLGTLLAYWSSLATLWACVQVKIKQCSSNLGSFPGSHAPECKHLSCAGED